MRNGIRRYLPLFKIRICSLIAFSAVVGLISASSSSVPVSLMSIVLLAAVTMMSSAGASAFNHYFDTDIDAMMERTSRRPLPSGAVADPRVVLAAAITLFAASIFLSFKVLNHMVALHLFLGGFVYAVVYTVWLKRRTWMNIIIGGLAGSFAVLAGGASATPDLCLTPVFLAVVMFFWTPSHFWSFALVHREEYERASIPMLPTVVGNTRTAWYILVNTVIMVLTSILPVVFGGLGAVYLAAALALGAYFILWNMKLLKTLTKDVARKNFMVSMAYLGGLFLAVIVDVWLR